MAKSESIAIVGMAGRFPGAANLEQFWTNLREGREAIGFFPEEEMAWLPIEHPPAPGDPRFVRARAVLERPEWFDAAFFRYNPQEAAIMDPQQRVFLECAWQALEDAGCNPDGFDGSIGVFAGAGFNSYLFNNLLTNGSLIADFGLFPVLTLNEKDYLATRVGYKLNLRGPCVSVQTACSTSLVATAIACQQLLTYNCDVALAGGVSITFPTNRGHHHLDGGIMSKDGHCRAFDAKATGAVVGSGAGVVVLKRLSDALAAGDLIRAVIKGQAVNNDGGKKIGFTAPSADGQAECVALAHAMAADDPAPVSYIEAHGTGTPLGDPIEMAALAQAFRGTALATQPCGVGSLKTNVGHLDVAAGVAGLIKTTLALQHGELPASLHFEHPNPEIDFAGNRFRVIERLEPWPRGTTPRRAGVSSFGIGGTNAHIVLEEPPTPTPGSASRRWQLLRLSARSDTALQAAGENLAAHLERHPTLNLADAAYTLDTGRKTFECRRAIVAADVAGAVAALRSAEDNRAAGGGTDSRLVFMFPGQGTQRVNAGRELYDTEPEFRRWMDEGCARVTPRLGLDLRQLLYPVADDGEAAAGATAEAGAQLLAETRVAQPALFVFEHALAKLWMHWGFRPAAMIGHSLGEYVAACVAGVFTLDEALELVTERGRLMQAQPTGSMLAVRLARERVGEWLTPALALAAVNSPTVSVIAGPTEAIAELETKLSGRAIPSQRLATSHAFHSSMVEGALPDLRRVLERITWRAPEIPWVSNTTGDWITPAMATSADYWLGHARNPVQFAAGIGALFKSGHRLLLEVGAGQTLSRFARQHGSSHGAVVAASLSGTGSDVASMLHASGQLWCGGAEPARPNGFYAEERRCIVALPTYPFQRKRYWIEPGTAWRNERPRPTTARPQTTEASTEPPTVEPARNDRSADVAAVDPIPELRALFEELSGADLSHAKRETTFNQLGFDSLFLSQAAVMVARRFGATLDFRQLRENLGTFGKLADYLEQHATFRGRGVAPVGRPTGAAGAASEISLPLTEPQREIWVVSQLGPGTAAAYHESALLEISGSLDRAALSRALDQVVARHEALRTRFAPAGDVQLVVPAARVPLEWRDFSAAGADARARAMAALDERLHAAFDLGHAPLLRAVVAQLGSDRHLFALIVHHIVCDGWSLGVLVRELADLYGTELGRIHPPLPAAPPFSASVRRDFGEQQPPAFAPAETYWKSEFVDGVPAFELPTDRARPRHRSYAAGFRTHVLPAALTANVKQFCAESECTVFTALLAVCGVLLHRLTGEADLVIGVPAAGQPLRNEPGLVGHFANLLPIRSRLNDADRFSAYLARIQASVNHALAHGLYPFSRLLQLLRLPRDASRMPLTPVLFNTNHHSGPLPFGDSTAHATLQPKHFTNFDLNFNLSTAGDSFVLSCYYSSELFHDATIGRWLGHFETLLRNLLVQPGAIAANVPLLTEAERQTLLVAWNDHRLELPPVAGVHELFEEQVRRTPEAVALIAGATRMTYRELNDRADRLADVLRASEVKRDTPVGLLLARTPSLVIAMLAVLKAGGAYVPLEPRHPPQRLGLIVADTAMPVAITERALLPLLPRTIGRRLVIDDPTAMAVTAGRASPDKPTGDDLAYIIYTSGSTGEPKGVCVPHRAVVALIAWARQHYRPEELAGVLFATSASFDVSVFECLVPLCLGGKVILADNLLQLDRLPAAREITLVSGVPSLVAELLRMGPLPGSVRTINLAGEPASPALVDALYALRGIERVYDLYGPTETTVYSTACRRERQGRATIGRPLPNEHVYILDRHQHPVPIGVRGEIYIGGAKLARGYLRRPAVTAANFMTLPHLPAGRVYRTGDAARFLPDGTIEYLGRLDRQVKIRGYRIELSEIESVLSRHPRVVDAAAVVHPAPHGTVQLVAYVVLAPPGTVTAEALRTHTAQWLPAPMVPTTFILVPELPRTASGKLDRKALPAPEVSAPPTDEPPQTEAQRLLAEIWGEALGVAKVGIHDNFFALGGNSLNALHLLARVEADFEVEISFEEFFAHPTIATLAERLEHAILEQERTRTAAVPRAESHADVPAATESR